MQVQVRNPLWGNPVWGTQPQYWFYTGEPVKVKHVKEHELALTTGDPDWPIRVIPRAWIANIDGVAVSAPQGLSASYTVAGSAGKSYTVTRSAEGAWHCTCSGFQFRKHCRHVEQLQKTSTTT